MHWTVLGPGAMGCLWAYYLHTYQNNSASKSSVHLIGRRSPVGAQALTLEKPGSPAKTIDVTLESVGAIKKPIESLLITTKSYDVNDAFQSVLPLLNPNSSVIILCNGIEQQQLLAKTYPEHRLYAMVTAQGAYLKAPFEVVHAGEGPTCIGPLTEAAKASPLSQLPLKTQWDEHIMQRMIDKLSVNAVINPLTALYLCPNGALLSDDHRDRFEALAKEVDAILHTAHLSTSKPVIELARSVAKSTQHNRSSSYQDVKHQRKTELQSFTGFLFKQAQALNIPCPQHQELMADFYKAGIILD